MRTLRASTLIVAIVMLLLLAGCGGGGASGGGGNNGGGGGVTPPPPPAPSTIAVTTTSLPDAVEGQPYTAQIAATGGTGTLSYQLQMSAGQWATIDATGKITGNPTYNDRGDSLLRVTIRDTNSQVTYAEFPVTVYLHLDANPQEFGNGTRGLAYKGETSVFSGKYPYVMDSVANLPPGLSVKFASGIITVEGTPTTAGNYTVQMVVKDSTNPPQTVTLNRNISIDSRLRLVSKWYPMAKIGAPFTGKVEAVNGTPPYTFSAGPGLANLGLTVDSAGNLTGALILVTGSSPAMGYGTQFTVTDSAGASDTNWETFSAYNPLQAYPHDGLSSVHVGDSFSAFLGGGGMWPLKNTMQFGQLPPGLSLDQQGLFLQGVFTTAGDFKFGIHTTDSGTPADSIDNAFEFQVSGPGLIANGGTLPGAMMNRSYFAPLQVTGGTQPLQWSQDGGELPPGMTLTADGVLHGTPTAMGRYNFGARVQDSATPQNSITNWYLVMVDSAPNQRNDSIATASVTSGHFDASLSPYADPVSITNPDTDYYRFTGKPGNTMYVSAARGYNGLVDTVLEIVNANGQRFQTCKNREDDQALDGIVADTTPLAYDDECLNDDATLGHPESSSLEFLVPDTGAPSTVFYVHVLDFSGNARPDFTYTLSVNGAAPVISITASPDQAYKGVPYSTALSLSGGAQAPYQFSTIQGAMPPGLSLPAPSLSPFPQISGTPTAAGHYTFTVQASDSASPAAIGTKTMAIDVADTPVLQFGTLPNGVTGQRYDASYTITGGIGPYFVNIAGSWPQGVGIENGKFTGIPKQDGVFTGTLTPQAGYYQTGAAVPYSFSIGVGPIVVQGLPAAKVGQVYDALMTASGGRTPYGGYTWTYVSGAPPGMTVANNWVHGIPTQAGTYSITMAVTDGSNPPQTSQATVTLIVQP